MADALFDVTGSLQPTPAFKDFAVDSFVINCMKTPSLGFSPPDEATRADYNARTAAINVAPGVNSRFNLDEIKADATWLSSNARINLEAALRVVVVEWQSRPASQLTGPLSAQEIMNLQEATGGADVLSNALMATLRAQEFTDAEDIASSFEKEENRRRRIFQTFLSERRHYALTLDFMHTNIFYGLLPYWGIASAPKPAPYIPEDNNDETACLVLAEKVAEKYLDFLSAAIDGANSYLSSLTDDPILNTPEIAAAFQETLFTEMAHAISIIFQAFQYLQLQYGEILMPPSIITYWFALMAKSSFLEIPVRICLMN